MTEVRNPQPKRMFFWGAARTGLLFLLTSFGWIAWERHLAQILAAQQPLPANAVDVCSMVFGYLLQAAGLGAFALMSAKRSRQLQKLYLMALLLHFACLLAALLSQSFIISLIFGLLQNFFCGILAGMYLLILARDVEKRHRAMAFALGYACAILVNYLLSLTGAWGAGTAGTLIISALLTGIALGAGAGDRGRRKLFSSNADVLSLFGEAPSAEAKERRSSETLFRRIALPALMVFLFSLVGGSAFSFSTADIFGEVPLALVRLAYAVSLLAAAFVVDADRRYGVLAAIIASAAPFVIPSLQAQGVPTGAFWVIGYFAASFFTVFRAVVFLDLAEEERLPAIAGFGLLFGRIGDALGEALCIGLGEKQLMLLGVQMVLFAAAVTVAFKANQARYLSQGKGLPGEASDEENSDRKPESHRDLSHAERPAEEHADPRSEEDTALTPTKSPDAESADGPTAMNREAAGSGEEERFHHFATAADLSLREQDILRFLLDGRTNSEIAAALSISENTVKFHVRNILRKASCANRKELLSAYWEQA